VVKTSGVCDFSCLAVTDWRLWFLALMTATQQVKSRYPEHVQDEQNLKIIMNLGYVHIGLPKPVMHYIIRMRVPKTCTERLYNIIRIPGIVRNHHRYFSFSVKVP